MFVIERGVPLPPRAVVADADPAVRERYLRAKRDEYTRRKARRSEQRAALRAAWAAVTAADAAGDRETYRTAVEALRAAHAAARVEK